MIYDCKFIKWSNGDLPESEVYKPRMTAKHYGREELSSRQKRQIDVMAGYHEPIWEPLPDYIHRDTGLVVNSPVNDEYDRIGTPLFYNKNRSTK